MAEDKSVLNRQWRQQGRTCVWRYRPMLKMYSGWHFSADQVGCDSLAELIDSFLSDDGAEHRTLSLSDPKAYGVDRIFGQHELKIEHPAKLRLGLVLGPEDVKETDDRVQFELHATGLITLRKAISDIRRGEGDFSESFGDHKTDPMRRVSFWCWPANA